MQLLMCPPHYYDVIYEINPWMNKNLAVDHARAELQWQTLCQLIQQCGIEILLLPPAPDLPDLVFTANAGLIYDHTVLLSHFKFPERQGEEILFRTWFQQHGFHVVYDANHSFEGEGDALFAGNILLVGYGFRSEKSYFSRLAKKNIAPLELCELVDPYFYHLDTCLCPLNDKQALWWPQAFSAATQRSLSQQLELFTVPENEAKRFSCNAIVIKDKIIIPSGCPETKRILKQLNFTVYDCDMSEYIKAGGAYKCLVLWVRK